MKAQEFDEKFDNGYKMRSSGKGVLKLYTNQAIAQAKASGLIALTL
ncbi:hypothetical protein HW132_05095 [Brasilonema sp. CT11]|nr:hypothetical protein [Brasilonema sp. CT11]